MKKEQLIEALKRVPDGAEIYLEHEVHDYWKTSKAIKANQLAQCPVKTENYSKVILDEGCDEAEEELWVLC